MKIDSLKRSRDFRLTCSKGYGVRTGCYILKFVEGNELRVGFIVSRKSGNAVQRNFIKRRLRHALDIVYSKFHIYGFYVFITNKNLAKIQFSSLLEIFSNSLQQISVLVKKNKAH